METERKIQWHPAFFGTLHTQIVVTKELEVDKHIWLCAISGPLDEIFIKNY